MAIQMRRGQYAQFDPTRLVPGEIAVVLSGDGSTTDGRAVYVCVAAGSVKRLTTAEEFATAISNAFADLEEAFVGDVQAATQAALDSAASASQTASDANSAASAATSAAGTATTAAGAATAAASEATSSATVASAAAQEARESAGSVSAAITEASNAAEDARQAAAQARGAVSANLRFVIDVIEIDGERRLVFADNGEE